MVSRQRIDFAYGENQRGVFMSVRWRQFILAMAVLVVADVVNRAFVTGDGAEFIELIIIAFVAIWLGEK